MKPFPLPPSILGPSRRLILVILGAAAAGVQAVGAQSPPPAKPDQPDQELLLKDFKPRSMLQVPEHPVEKARFPVIDFHGHLGRMDPQEALRVMEATNVQTIIDFDGGSGPALEEQKARYAGLSGRVVHFARLNWRWINDADFSSRSAKRLEEDVKAGARGLKVSKMLGLYLRDDEGKLVAVNDPRFDPIWAKCGELGIPVAIHIADPDAFFLPLDEFNEQYDALKRNPGWHFYGKDFPSKNTLLKQRNEILARHPGITFLGLHVANRSENLAEVANLLDRFPNLYVEFGARVNELGRQPYTARRFFLKYADRILFGLDRSSLSPYHYRVYFRFLETSDEYFSYNHRPGLGRWQIYGIHLSDDILRKVYYQNAQKLLGLK